ncbi:MAG: hypothetical protein JKX98_06915 [Alcanivoracaceae bacterium]|nr:hypothetical protein [Alcanivoracaceae bacterium]
MKSLLILLLMSNIAMASNLEPIETDEKLNESLALSQHFKEFSILQKGSTNWRSVGAGGCQYSSIQAAIDDYTQSPLGLIGIPVEFRIATNKTYFENLVIGGNYDISLTGGYSDCSNMAGTPGNNQVLIHGGFNGTVLKIQGVTTRRTMVFTNLRLFNGNNAAGAGAGLLSDNSNVSLLLENVDIRNNSAQFGAGLAIIGGDTDLLMNESLIFSNVADYGGGIYCSGGASSVNVANHSGIISNSATGTAAAPSGRGGGAYIDTCYFAIFTGSTNNFSFTGMEGNSSTDNGGAIYAQNAIIRLHGHQSCGSLGCLGDDTNPVSFRNNQASNGAVLYAKNTDVRINATWMEENVGNSMINLEESGLLLERFLQPCWSNVNCNLIESNVGIVIVGFNINDTNISNTTFKNNFSEVLRIVNFNLSNRKSLNIESNVFFNNGSMATANRVLGFFGALDVSLIHNTIVDNEASNAAIYLDWTPSNSISPIFAAHSNIIDNPGLPLLSHSILSSSGGFDTVDVNISALITNETDSI